MIVARGLGRGAQHGSIVAAGLALYPTSGSVSRTFQGVLFQVVASLLPGTLSGERGDLEHLTKVYDQLQETLLFDGQQVSAVYVGDEETSLYYNTEVSIVFDKLEEDEEKAQLEETVVTDVVAAQVVYDYSSGTIVWYRTLLTSVLYTEDGTSLVDSVGESSIDDVEEVTTDVYH